MEFARIIKKEHFDHNLGRFKSLAIRNPSAPISVIRIDCAEDISTCLCEHITKYYASLDTDPRICWLFDSSILPEHCTIDNAPSNTGDEYCHYDITGITKKDARRLLPHQMDAYYVCLGNTIEKLEDNMHILTR